MNTAEQIEAALPEVARRAGRREIAQLAERVDAAGGAHPEVLAKVLLELGRELIASNQRNARLGAALAASRASGGGSAAVLDALAELSRGPGLAGDLEALERNLDEQAVELRLRLDGLAHRQRWALLAALVTDRAHEVFEPDLRASLTGDAVALAGGTQWGWPLRVAACRLAARLATSDDLASASVRQGFVELALDASDHVWVQAAALEAITDLEPDVARAGALLVSVAVPDPARQEALPADHAFVRARAISLIAKRGLRYLLRRALAAREPSEHVLITTVRALGAASTPADHQALLRRFSAEDAPPSARVRAAAILALLPDVPRVEADCRGPLTAASVLLEGVIDRRWHEVVLRGLLDRLNDGAFDAATAAEALERLGPGIARLAGEDALDEAAELAFAVLRRLRIEADERLEPMLRAAEAALAPAHRGAVVPLRAGPLAEAHPDDLLQVLAAIAFDGHDLAATPLRGLWRGASGAGWLVRVGDGRRLQPWRVANELRHPRPDKRQAGSHLVGPSSRGALFALSARGGEVTPTGVPGRRVAENSDRLRWASELPLPGLFQAAARRRDGVDVLAPGGRFTVHAPGIGARLRAQRRFVGLSDARERLRHLPDGGSTREFDALAARWGFEIRRQPVERWLPLGAFAAVPGGLREVTAGLLEVGTNSIPQLTALSAGLTAAWLVGNIRRARAIRRWRASIPLVVGGWGSRGKSGSERLKAALFHDLGYSVVAKTTGCEAMVVVSVPGGPPVEIPLYRPRDKASIAEQRRILEFAARFGTQVMLWECMALNPQYVQILQSEWMRDDISTLTNTYPDHEDLHGPGGEEVAETIGCFLLPGGRAVTTEQHMVPILRERASTLDTALTVCRREDWELLPADITARLPYDEHPRNVALVTRLAAELGVPADVAWKGMADEVVPDLGVLKSYGPIPYAGRRVTFVNGMSANERAGFLSNWGRVGLDVPGAGSGLDEWLVLLVNNRADRLARQSVFAALCAVDATFDTLAVIGTNVEAFGEEWRAALEERLAPRLLDLGAGEGGSSRLANDLARRLRRPVLERAEAGRRVAERSGLSDAEVARLLDAEWPRGLDAEAAVQRVVALGAPGPEDGPTEAAQRWLRELAWIAALPALPASALPGVVASALRVIEARFHPLRDPALSGDQVFDRLARCAPVGASVSLLGSANIKGTGLAFVYGCLAADRLLLLRETFRSGTAQAIRAALRALSPLPSTGFLEAEVAIHLIEDSSLLDQRQRGEVATEADRVLRALCRRRDELKPSVFGAAGSRSGGRGGVLGGVDLTRSLACRRDADALLRDLADHRVGLARAAAAARAINDRALD
jgi:poly-gamma-glutamate synthase PgsB/CapB